LESETLGWEDQCRSLVLGEVKAMEPSLNMAIRKACFGNSFTIYNLEEAKFMYF